MWSVPLTTAMCSSVKDLIDHAVQLDVIRRHRNETSPKPVYKPKEN